MFIKTYLNKKYIVFAICALTVFAFALALAPDVFAQDAGLETIADTTGLGQTDIRIIIGNIIRIALGFVGIIAVILIIYGGFTWMTAGGNEERVTKAKNILKQAVIGLAIVLASLAITTFIMNALGAATGLQLGAGEGTGAGVTEKLSDALGSGALEDHYPARNATGIARNTKIMVSFKDEMYIPSFIADYDVSGTAADTSDDIVPETAGLNTDNIKIYATEDGGSAALSTNDVSVTFTDDLKTFVFDPPVLGSAVEATNYTVSLSANILDVDQNEVFTGRSSDGYEWSFEVSTEVDNTPPTVKSIVPTDGSEYDRNIVVQIIFDEAMDPTAVSGSYDSTEGGFTNLLVQADTDGDGTFSPLSGDFEISSAYKVVEFTPADACGTNSCNETVYCLPGIETIQVKIKAADLSAAPPEADTPYNGAVDMSGNSLDGNDNGTAEGPDTDNYSIEFTTTNDVNLEAPHVESVSPQVLGEDVDVDQDVVIVWDTLMKAKTLTNNVIDILSNPDHEMWYRSQTQSLDSNGDEITSDEQSAAKTELTIKHGVFLESQADDPETAEDESSSQLYATSLPDDIRSLYQNCFYPAEGPGGSEAETCAGTSSSPYCCNGSKSIGGFDEDSFSCF